MRELTTLELEQVGGAGTVAELAKGLASFGTALVGVGGVMALVPGGQAAGLLVALNGAVYVGAGLLLQMGGS